MSWNRSAYYGDQRDDYVVRPQSSQGLDIGNILNAGMAFMNTKSKGGSNIEASVNAIVSSSAMGGSYRSQSGSLVANALMQAVKGMANKK